MSLAELRALGEDIYQNGLLEPIKYVKRDGLIIVVDGQNRLDAMELMGLPIIKKGQINWQDFQLLHLETDAEVVAHVISANIQRRHQHRRLCRRVPNGWPAC
jgi:ParB-like chromosome segregation protein Spo0J